MSKLFLSYRRKSWPFTHRLADELAKRLETDIFVDYTGVDEANFEKSILRHLRESSAMLLVVSEHTFVTDRIQNDEDWIRREIREALAQRLPIVLVCVEGLLPPGDLPDDIKEVTRSQGINFYPDYFIQAVENLAQFVVRIGAAKRKSAVGATPTRPDIQQATLDEALARLDEGDFGKAIFLLEQLRESGYKSRFLDLSTLIGDARSHQEKIEQRYNARMAYDEIVALAGRKFTEERAREAFEKWCSEYNEFAADLDSAQLSERFRPAPRLEPVSVSSPLQPQPQPQPQTIAPPAIALSLLPKPFGWIDIPAGKIALVTWTEKDSKSKESAESLYPHDDKEIVDVGAFTIAKYPVTNAQFGKFIEGGGYSAHKWWTEIGWQIRRVNEWDEPRYWPEHQYEDTNPVVGVSWYEAIAFCHWLRDVTGENITLLREEQWQRAAQGNSARAYAWGDTFNETRCNSSVKTRSKGPTPVAKYEANGSSPFGVVDMTGNVWEWCLNDHQHKTDLEGKAQRMVRGGGWGAGSNTRLRVDYRLLLQPDVRNIDVGFRIARAVGHG